LNSMDATELVGSRLAKELLRLAGDHEPAEIESLGAVGRSLSDGCAAAAAAWARACAAVDGGAAEGAACMKRYPSTALTAACAACAAGDANVPTDDRRSAHRPADGRLRAHGAERPHSRAGSIRQIIYLRQQGPPLVTRGSAPPMSAAPSESIEARQVTCVDQARRKSAMEREPACAGPRALSVERGAALSVERGAVLRVWGGAEPACCSRNASPWRSALSCRASSMSWLCSAPSLQFSACRMRDSRRAPNTSRAGQP
jgi:hypothetical protein